MVKLKIFIAPLNVSYMKFIIHLVSYIYLFDTYLLQQSRTLLALKLSYPNYISFVIIPKFLNDSEPYF